MLFNANQLEWDYYGSSTHACHDQGVSKTTFYFTVGALVAAWVATAGVAAAALRRRRAGEGTDPNSKSEPYYQYATMAGDGEAPPPGVPESSI